MANVSTVLLKDSVIADITPDLTYAIKSGASSKTYQQFPATSVSNSNLVFNVNVPSENIVIDREVLISAPLTFTVRIAGCPAATTVCDYGLREALQAFPLASIMTTLNAQINNTNVSINIQDVLPQILAMTSARELQRWNGLSPSFRDNFYYNYVNAAGASNNPLGSADNTSLDGDIQSRGAFPVVVNLGQYSAAGAWVSNSPTCATLGNVFYLTVQTVVTEPLFLSPFIYSNPEFNAQGLLGINNMVIQANIDQSLKRVFSTVGTASNDTALTYTISPGATVSMNGALVVDPTLFKIQTNNLLNVYGQNPTLLFNFLSTQPSDVLETKNSVPYMDLPRYITSSVNTNPVAAGNDGRLVASSIQLNQIPDLFIICVRKPMSEQTIVDSSSFLRFKSININLNNSSGLLSSMTPFEAWKMSCRNGSQQSWAEFSGQATYKNTAAGAGTGVGQLVSTTGSLLVINPAFDLSLPDYLTCGSIGTYNFQFTIEFTNQSDEDFSPEIVTVCANSGVFVTQQGQSQVFTGLATKEMTLAAKADKEPASRVQYARMVGGKLMNMMGLRHRLGSRMNGMAQKAEGMAVGGYMSGGGKKKLHSLC